MPTVFDLTDVKENKLANQQFALNLYRPDFPKNKRLSETEKAIKVAEVRKQLKKIRTHLVFETDKRQHLSSLLALIVSDLIDFPLELSVSAKEGAVQWEQLTISADLLQIQPLEEAKAARLIQAADNLGHFHSKPLNTLSSVQFCRDPEFSASGEFGLTENQLENTATLSISGGSNAFSVYYAILITRINGLAIAEHLIQTTPLGQDIQQFFKRFLSGETLTALQQGITTALSKTAQGLDALHVMDKQITLPIPNDNGCEYLNITPIINPTVFAATSRSLFYVKNQSVVFMNVELGGTNPSNAGTAVGEVAGQNARLKMAFPVMKTDYVQKKLYRLNYQGCYFWRNSLKSKITQPLLQYEYNDKLPNDKKRDLLENAVRLMMDEMQQQLQEIGLYLASLSTEQQQKVLDQKYGALFNDKKSKGYQQVWLDALIKSVRRLPKLKENIDFQPVIREINQQFNHLIHHQGGL